jgi:hypothetical protein
VSRLSHIAQTRLDPDQLAQPEVRDFSDCFRDASVMLPDSREADLCWT